MKHSGTSFRSVLALVLLLALAAGCFSLGMWQLGRAAERDALHDMIERGRKQAPLVLSAASRPADFLPWRAATAQGQWLPQYTLLLENRNLDGRPGYWVATPLQLDAAYGGPAVLVLRGWVPRDMHARGVLPAIPAEPGTVLVQGELHDHVPRIFELWEWAGGSGSRLPAALPAHDISLTVVQNLELAEYARATGLRLLPTVLAQTHETRHVSSQAAAQNGEAATPGIESNGTTAASQLVREWPGPSLDSDQNRGYALQWFSFCAIAVIAALFVSRGLLRRSATASRSKEAP